MTSKKIVRVRKKLEMTQVEFANALGVSAQTVSNWETGHRSASSLAVRAIEMLRDMGGGERKRLREKLQSMFVRLNAECFGNQIKRKYRFRLSRGLRRSRSKVMPSKRLIIFSLRHRLNDDSIEAMLKHEMVHLWLYERGRRWWHAMEFKTKLKSIGG